MKKIALITLMFAALTGAFLLINSAYAGVVDGPDVGQVVDKNEIIKILRRISAASENYAAVEHHYPGYYSDLMNANPPYINEEYISGTYSGYIINGTTDYNYYEYEAIPIQEGPPVFVVSTGGVMTPGNEKANNIAWAKVAVKSLAIASEGYKQTFGTYPETAEDIDDWMSDMSWICDTVFHEFVISCENSVDSYQYVAKPTHPDKSGNKAYQVTTGFVFLP